MTHTVEHSKQTSLNRTVPEYRCDDLTVHVELSENLEFRENLMRDMREGRGEVSCEDDSLFL